MQTAVALLTVVPLASGSGWGNVKIFYGGVELASAATFETNLTARIRARNAKATGFPTEGPQVVKIERGALGAEKTHLQLYFFTVPWLARVSPSGAPHNNSKGTGAGSPETGEITAPVEGKPSIGLAAMICKDAYAPLARSHSKLYTKVVTGLSGPNPQTMTDMQFGALSAATNFTWTLATPLPVTAVAAGMFLEPL